mmetsp:Transcript_9319/g.14692  ORF Transcript_9319/g.14692 Transcript_9319/m.14692 type:complete len:226 (+) Transcript_9319:77-754(+)
MGTSSSRHRNNNSDISNGQSSSSSGSGSRSGGRSGRSGRRRDGRDGRDTAESVDPAANNTTGSNGTSAPRPQPQKPPIPVLYQTDVIHNHVNLHRNSINLRKAEGSDSKFQLEFSFDCEVDCKLKIWYVAEENTDNNDLTVDFNSTYPVQPADVCIEKGMGLKHTVAVQEAFAPAKVQGRRKLYYHQGSNQYPLVIILSTLDENEPQMQVKQTTAETPVSNGLQN